MWLSKNKPSRNKPNRKKTTFWAFWTWKKRGQKGCTEISESMLDCSPDVKSLMLLSPDSVMRKAEWKGPAGEGVALQIFSKFDYGSPLVFFCVINLVDPKSRIMGLGVMDISPNDKNENIWDFAKWELKNTSPIWSRMVLWSFWPFPFFNSK